MAISIDELCDLVTNNLYVQKCRSNKSKDYESLSYIIKRQMSQSDCIKLGNGIEKLLSDFILKNSTLKNIKKKNVKGQKECDHLFIDDDNKIVYYAELKTNINLDTEKYKATCEKCILNVQDLEKEYPEHTIKWCLLACRHLTNEKIDTAMIHKYKKISNNFFGINDYLKMLCIDKLFTDETYTAFVNMAADKMFSDSF